MPRIQPLSTTNAGMTRLRTKGNADPATLYDCLNAYITLAGTIRPRPGTQTDITLPTDTKGMVAHNCRIYVFSHIPQVTSNPDKYVVATLRHPTDATLKLAQIHFAAPFMGFLYVAAEFEDGNVWHYWLEELDAWTAGTDYKVGDRVFATVENGFAYKASRPGSAYPAWAAGVERSVNDIIEPTVYNGFKYTVTVVSGTNPASGQIEPDWPAEAGAQVVEYTAGNETGVLTTSVLEPDPDVREGGTSHSSYYGTIGGYGTSTWKRP